MDFFRGQMYCASCSSFTISALDHSATTTPKEIKSYQLRQKELLQNNPRLNKTNKI